MKSTDTSQRTVLRLGRTDPRVPINIDPGDLPRNPPVGTESVSETPSEPGNAGRIRVTVNGFRVHNQTWDHALQLDGKGDEIQVRCPVSIVDKDGKKKLAVNRNSYVYGDVTGLGHQVGGSASDEGGLVSGDNVPNGTEPHERAGDPTAFEMPMLLYEGDLTEGTDVLIAAPSLWEIDGQADGAKEWLSLTQREFSKVADKVAPLLGPEAVAIAEGIDLGIDITVRMQDADLFGSAGDRPIGMQEQGEKTYMFEPQVLVMDLEKARWMAEQNTGLGPGVIELSFEDDDRLRGEYSLFVQIEALD